MATQIAEVEPVVGRAAQPAVSAPSAIFEDDFANAAPPIRVVRGIAIAVMISIPFWIVFGVALYLLW